MTPRRSAVAIAFCMSQLCCVCMIPANSGGVESDQETSKSAPPVETGLIREEASRAVVLKRVEPEYTPEARAAGLQGSVVLYLEVSAAGEVEAAHVIQSLGLGLDEKAVEAVKQWRFRPGTQDGIPVRAEQSAEVSFLLQPATSWRIRRCWYKPVEPRFSVPKRQSEPVLYEYTSPSREACLSNAGVVVVGFNITRKGEPENVEVVEQHGESVSEAALTAISSWRFQPATRNRKPIAGSGAVEMECRPHSTSDDNFSEDTDTSVVYAIGKDVSAPAILYKVQPDYSEEARRARRHGTVLLSIQVDQSGHAINMSVLRSLGLGLDESAMKAINQWRFRPAAMDGSPWWCGRKWRSIFVSYRDCQPGARAVPGTKMQDTRIVRPMEVLHHSGTKPAIERQEATDIQTD
jgi:TonB family protein